MKITYDSVADAAYIYLVDHIKPGEVARTDVSGVHLDSAAIALDFDAAGKLLGVEILGAAAVLSRETITAAEQLG